MSIENISQNRVFYTSDNNYKNTIKPLPSNSKLIKNNPIIAPKHFVQNTIYDMKSLKKGLTGEASDYELGRLNDVGMKLGGVLMTLYLMGKEPTFKKKLGPLIGVTSFFASMAIWPKIALQLPARIIHGFNIMQEYQDSAGRKKPFYQDTQFIPWDLYSDKDIDKFGDRLNVPQNISNRRDYIQEKMRKIALQNNTMWMLTAGFATPIMAALATHKLQPIVNNFRLDKIKQAVLGENSKHYIEKNEKKVSEFVTDYCENVKNDLLKIFNINGDDLKIAKETPEDAQKIILAKLKSLNPEESIISKLDEIIKIESNVTNKDSLKELESLKFDYLKLLHIAKNKDVQDTDVLLELISRQSDMYAEAFNRDGDFWKYGRKIFGPNEEEEKTISNEKVREEYKKFKSAIFKHIKNDEERPKSIQSSDSLISNISKEKTNNNAWFNTVGKTGLGLLGVTLLPQFFFGKMEDQEK